MPPTKEFRKLKIRYRGKWEWNSEEKKLEFHQRQNKTQRWHWNQKHPQPNVEKTKPPPSHGRDIYFWWNVQNKRVVYSFTKEMNNNKALKQLTFVGKKTVPAALRKDMWRLFLHVQFQSQRSGLLVWHYLREFRKRHETAYDPKILTTTKRPERMKWLMDQKANSVADLAASLKQSEDNRMRIYWDDLYDAEYAKSWPKTVEHDTIKYDRGTGVIIIRETLPEPGEVPAAKVGVEEVEGTGSTTEPPETTTKVEEPPPSSTATEEKPPSSESSWLKKLKGFMPSLGGRRSSPKV